MSHTLPDRGHLTTEQRLDATMAIDAVDTEQVLRMINTQDAQIHAVVRKQIPAITKLVQAVVERLNRGGRLIYVGAGTSGRLGVLDASECPPTFFCDPGQVIGIIAGGDTALRKSSEGAEDDPCGAHEQLTALNVHENDIVVGIMAGGTTPYVWGALRFAADRNAATALICCVTLHTILPRSKAPLHTAKDKPTAPHKPQLPVQVDHPIELVVGPEVVTGSTRMKAGTATKLALNMITTGAMIQLGKTWGNLMVDLRATNTKLADRASRILMTQCDLSREQALKLLESAGGRVKIALVMANRNIDAPAAQLLLDRHQQKLRPILGAPK
jgi:N-acetylmuramic acid 6-phosphate etherase